MYFSVSSGSSILIRSPFILSGPSALLLLILFIACLTSYIDGCLCSPTSFTDLHNVLHLVCFVLLSLPVSVRLPLNHPIII
jgi:hypothetical protein